MSIVEQARRADDCLDFAITADLLDSGRINIFERWESQAAVEAFRSSGPRRRTSTPMFSASVAEYGIAGARTLLGKAQHERAPGARPDEIGAAVPSK